ncbi:MAG: phosphoglucosamine mutase, partial [Pseudomonadota bacterium]|nr:phosphoglucosamine mutase [Pseudomonadota bacterium]
MQKNYFGTDGIRDKIGNGLMNPETILKLGWATGMALKEQNFNDVIIGKDTRISGYLIESALESGLVSAGINIGLLGPMPTPAISYLTSTFRCGAGVVISASHNPYYDNGIKVFGHDGFKISEQIEKKISHYMDQKLQMVAPHKIGKATRINGAPDRYIEFCKSKFLSNKSLKGIKIVLDCANGATYHIAEKVFRELGANVIVLGNNPDGFNINSGCGSTHLADICEKVKQSNANIGISFDGDGDRTIMIDEFGNEVDGDSILYILTKDLYQRKKILNTGVVGTVMTNLALEKELESMNIPFTRASVGDKHIMRELNNRNWFLGGEPSGHVLNLKKTNSGDGIITSLLVINAMLTQDNSLSDILKGFEKYPQNLIAIPCNNPTSAFNSQKLQEIIKNTDKFVSKRERILIRASGTEPKIRLMVEGECRDIVDNITNEIKNKIYEVLK